MRQFAKYTLATITGIIIATTVMVLIAVTIGMASLALSGSKPAVKDNSVLYLNLSGMIAEHTESNPFNEILGQTSIEQQGLDDIVGAIDKAAKDDRIKGIYIEAGLLMADYAVLQEMRNALERFPKEKFIVSYADEYTQDAYYVCSAADKIYINPQGMVDIHGISASAVFLKDMLAKVGVKMKVVKVGAYKSATETYTETKMSEANREQVTRYTSNIWNAMASDISKSRGMTLQQLNILADDYTAFTETKDLIAHKLVDKVMYANEVKNEVKALLKIDKEEEIEQISCADYCKAEEAPASFGEKKIAVYYCEGTIVQVAEAGAIMSDAGIVSKKVTKDLDDLAKDDDVKAVVLRINSGGGDAFASEQIWHSVAELKKKKPVVVSMSGAAASGAYYMSAPASWIVAQPTTLTGSIGIFGVFPDMSGLMQEKLGLKYDNVKTNRNADLDLTQASHPLTPEQEMMLQRYIDRGYELFCKRVADGRKIPMEQVKKIAQGRVWTGADAKAIKLVDELGGMQEAMNKAAALAKLKDYETVSYPKAKDWMEELMESAKGHNNLLDEQLKQTLGAYYEPFLMVKKIQQQSPIQARCEFILVK